MGHYLSEMEETEEQIKAQKEREERSKKERDLVEKYLRDDIADRGIAAVLADILQSSQNYRDLAMWREKEKNVG